MSQNASYQLNNCSILTVSTLEASEVVTSTQLDEMMAPALEATKSVKGTIERLAGVRERRWFPRDEDYTDGAVDVARLALEESGVAPEKIGLVINASVTRPHLEPGISSKVHAELGLSRGALAFDVTNACLGVVNAMQIAGTMIDAGQVEYALVVASEGVREMQENTIERLNAGQPTKAEVKEAFATMTLGSGAVAVLLGRSDAHPDAHRVVRGVTRAGTEHHELCMGGMEGMRTQSSKLFREGLALAVDAWNDADPAWDWAGADWFVAHQTSTGHIASLAHRLHLDVERFPVTVQEFGNIGPVSMPYTLGVNQHRVNKGERVLLMGIGSGLNTSFMEVEW